MIRYPRWAYWHWDADAQRRRWRKFMTVAYVVMCIATGLMVAGAIAGAIPVFSGVFNAFLFVYFVAMLVTRKRDDRARSERP